MGWMRNFADEYHRLRQADMVPPVFSDPRPLAPSDIVSWDIAASERPSGPARTMDRVKRDLINRNPVKWRRLQKEYRYFQKQMEKMGLNPEDVRFLL
jgi:hypothetical protein